MRAHLILSDGTRYEGETFGATTTASGEVVFNTGMTGYPETLTDPSYAGQILILSYPLIGNYGVPGRRKAGSLPAFFESTRIHPRGLVVADYTAEYSHFEAERSLDEWLKAEGIPALMNVDTRAVVKHLREKGAMLGAVVPEGGRPPRPLYDPGEENVVAAVSVNMPILYLGRGGRKARPRVVLVDCGAKANIVRSLTERGADVLRVPWDYDFTKDEHDAVVISNGPGDPTRATATIAHVKKALRAEKPLFGICLGSQIMALAAGATTYKLHFGHRGHNQPVIERGGRRTYITSQNHGYAVEEKSLPDGWEPWFTNVNDGTNEGIRHTRLPFRAVQFHPEANPGPTDTAFLFDNLLDDL